MKKLISSFLTVALIFALLPMGVFQLSAKAATAGSYTYEIKDGGAVITKVDYSIGSEVIVPSTLGGYPVTEIGSGAFATCEWTESIVFPDSVKKIGANQFLKLDNLTSVTLGNGLEEISSNAFAKSYGLKSIVIPDSVKSIGVSAFTHCTALETVVLSSGVTKLPERVFYSCNSLKSVTIPEGVTNIGTYAFGYCEALQKVNVPNSVKRIEKSAFYGCSSLENVTFGTGVDYIGNSAFMGCSAFTSIIIPDNVKTIAASAFGCSKVTEIKIGKGVSSIGLNAFSSEALTSFVVDENNPYYCSVDGVLFDKNKQTLINYPQAKADTTYTIPNTVKKVDSYAFFSCPNLKNVIISDSVKTINSSAFSSCPNLESIVIPGTVTVVGKNAFSSCASVKSITIGSGVESIGDGAFMGCTSITSVTIPDSVTGIGIEVFKSCGNLETVKTGAGIPKISESMFESCESLKDVEIGSGVQSIDFYAFKYCDSLKNIVVPNTVTKISKSAFYENKSLESITLPFIGTSAEATETTYFSVIFGGYSVEYNEMDVPKTLKEVIITGGGTVPATSFKLCKNITSVIVKSGVTTIGEGAFNSCESLKNVTLDEGVTTIETYAFYNCFALESVGLPKSITKIAAKAFNTCYDIKNVYYRGIDKSAISIGKTNDPLTNANWIYNSCIGSNNHSFLGGCGDPCSICGYVREGNVHSYVSTTIPCTETQQGYTEHVCSDCGHTYRDNYIGTKIYGVVAEASDIDITVTWEGRGDAIIYYVRAIAPDGTSLSTKQIKDGSTSYTFTGLEYDNEYSFIVYAKLSDGSYLKATDADVVSAHLVLGDRVVGIKSSVKGRTITVSWMAYPEADRYYVMVYPKGADPAVSANRVTTVNAGNKTTVDIINAIAPETDYEIYVSARVGGKYQALDNALYTSAVIPVTAPNSFEITSIEPTIVRIKWNAVKNADRYWARLVDDKGNTVMTKQSLKALISFTKLTPGKTYYVQLQARVPKSSGGNQYSGYCDPIKTQPITLPLK